MAEGKLNSKLLYDEVPCTSFVRDFHFSLQTAALLFFIGKLSAPSTNRFVGLFTVGFAHASAVGVAKEPSTARSVPKSSIRSAGGVLRWMAVAVIL